MTTDQLFKRSFFHFIFRSFKTFCRGDENLVRRAQSYNQAEKVMPASAAIVNNSKITFGVLPDSKMVINVPQVQEQSGVHFNIGFEEDSRL